jgi:ankyrin repeat protein
MRSALAVAAGLASLMLGGAALSAADTRLVDAVKRGDRQEAQSMLQQHPEAANLPDADGTSPLHWAVHRNDLEMADLLLRGGASVRTANRYGVQPLVLAAANGNAAIAERLLAAGADPATSLNGETVLMTAARSGSVDTAALLVDRGAEINAKESWRGQSALMWAAAEGHVDVVRMLIRRGANIHDRSKVGFTALLFAARQGQIDTAMALLDAGANPDDALQGVAANTTAGSGPATPQVGVNAFLIAAGNAHYQLATLFLERGADPNAAPRGWSALHQVSWVRKAGVAGSNNPAPPGSGSMDSLEFVRTLVLYGADIEARVTKRPPAGVTGLNMVGATPFLLAARTADAEYMKLLADLGANPLAANEDGTTALMIAAGVGTYAPGEDPGTEPEVLEAVQLALALGNDINAVDYKGETAMHGAAAKHAPSVVRYLAQSGARIEIWDQPNHEGFTPLRIAEGIHRGMSIVRSPVTEAAIREVMASQGALAAR